MVEADASIVRTRASLLFRLQALPGDQVAWRQLVDLYGPQVFAWCRRWGLQEADAADVTQSVLLQLTRKLPDFHYDPSKRFRAWIKTLAHHAWSDFHRASKGTSVGTGDTDALLALHQLPARDDLVERLQATFDRELLDRAMIQVQGRVDPHTWQAFYLTAIDGLSGAEVAGRLAMQVGTVFKARSKVQRMLQDIIRDVEEAEA